MDKVADLLKTLAEKLGTTVEHLWPYLVRKTQIDWIAETCGWVLVLTVASFVYVKVIIPWFKNTEYDHYGDPLSPKVALGVGAALLTIMLVIFVSHLCSVSCLIVPEAATVERLIYLASPKR